MKNFVKIWSAIKGLSIPEMVVIGTIFLTSIGWVYKVNAQIEKGCERDKKFVTVESEIQDIKIDIAEIKTSNKEISENVKLLLVRGLNARDNR
jgi:hypothetical protein